MLKQTCIERSVYKDQYGACVRNIPPTKLFGPSNLGFLFERIGDKNHEHFPLKSACGTRDVVLERNPHSHGGSCGRSHRTYNRCSHKSNSDYEFKESPSRNNPPKPRRSPSEDNVAEIESPTYKDVESTRNTSAACKPRSPRTKNEPRDKCREACDKYMNSLLSPKVSRHFVKSDKFETVTCNNADFILRRIAVQLQGIQRILQCDRFSNSQDTQTFCQYPLTCPHPPLPFDSTNRCPILNAKDGTTEKMMYPCNRKRISADNQGCLGCCFKSKCCRKKTEKSKFHYPGNCGSATPQIIQSVRNGDYVNDLICKCIEANTQFCANTPQYTFCTNTPAQHICGEGYSKCLNKTTSVGTKTITVSQKLQTQCLQTDAKIQACCVPHTVTRQISAHIQQPIVNEEYLNKLICICNERNMQAYMATQQNQRICLCNNAPCSCGNQKQTATCIGHQEADGCPGAVKTSVLKIKDTIPSSNDPSQSQPGNSKNAASADDKKSPQKYNCTNGRGSIFSSLYDECVHFFKAKPADSKQSKEAIGNENVPKQVEIGKNEDRQKVTPDKMIDCMLNATNECATSTPQITFLKQVIVATPPSCKPGNAAPITPLHTTYEGIQLTEPNSKNISKTPSASSPGKKQKYCNSYDDKIKAIYLGDGSESKPMEDNSFSWNVSSHETSISSFQSSEILISPKEVTAKKAMMVHTACSPIGFTTNTSIPRQEVVNKSAQTIQPITTNNTAEAVPEVTNAITNTEIIFKEEKGVAAQNDCQLCEFQNECNSADVSVQVSVEPIIQREERGINVSDTAIVDDATITTPVCQKEQVVDVQKSLLPTCCNTNENNTNLSPSYFDKPALRPIGNDDIQVLFMPKIFTKDANTNTAKITQANASVNQKSSVICDRKVTCKKCSKLPVPRDKAPTNTCNARKDSLPRTVCTNVKREVPKGCTDKKRIPCPNVDNNILGSPKAKPRLDASTKEKTFDEEINKYIDAALYYLHQPPLVDASMDLPRPKPSSTKDKCNNSIDLMGVGQIKPSERGKELEVKSTQNCPCASNPCVSNARVISSHKSDMTQRHKNGPPATEDKKKNGRTSPTKCNCSAAADKSGKLKCNCNKKHMEP